MHEISLCENIRTLLEEAAVAQKFERVTGVWLDVGTLSCVEPEALRFGFDAVMRGSVAEGAALQIDMVQSRMYCLTCQTMVPVEQRFDACPQCGATDLRPGGEDTLRIRKVEVV